MKTLALPAALAAASLLVTGCVATNPTPGLANPTSPAARACVAAVAERTGRSDLEVFAHVPVSGGAFTNVEIRGGARYMCRTGANNAVLEVLPV
ncbi:hypothetical protein [Roseicyclus sp.]|uniref:hypothetical protein n=1 Tax=Roseicyclus sp. TaxID=1914329 RepID=UPI003F9EFB34